MPNLPLTGLLDHLESNGIQLSNYQHIQVQKFLDTLPLDYSISSLKWDIAPIISRNQREQEVFYQAFDQFFLFSKTNSKPGEDNKKPRKWWDMDIPIERYLINTLIFAIIVLIVFLVLRESLFIDINNLQVNPQDGQNSFWEVFNDWYFLLFVGVTSLLTFVLYLFFSRKNQRRSKEFEEIFNRGRNPPYTIPIPSQEDRLVPEPDVITLATRLRRLSIENLPTLNIEGTIRSTISKGGYPNLVYNLRKASPNYLVLVDRKHEQDHQAKLLALFMKYLQNEDVSITIYYFEGSPKLCYFDDFSSTVQLEDLYTAHPSHKLMVFGDSSVFINPVSGKFKKWVQDQLFAWEERLWLSPKAVSSWGFYEKFISQEFLICASDFDSLMNLPHIFSSKNSEEEYIIEGDNIPSINFYDPNDLKQFLGFSAYQWLITTLIYSEIHWEMSLAIGIDILNGNFEDPKLERLEINYNNLKKLCQIPWLQTGEIPTPLKRELLLQLHPEIEKVARQTILNVLKNVEIDPNSFAHREYQIQRSIQEAILTPQRPRVQEKFQYMRRKGYLDEDLLDKTQLESFSKLINFRFFSKNLIKTPKKKTTRNNFYYKSINTILFILCFSAWVGMGFLFIYKHIVLGLYDPSESITVGFEFYMLYTIFLGANLIFFERVFGRIEKLDVLTLLWRLFFIGVVCVGIMLISIISLVSIRTLHLGQYIAPILFFINLYAQLIFFLSAIFIFKRFILYQRTQNKILAWQILLALLGLGTLFPLFLPLLKAPWSYTPFFVSTIFIVITIYLGTSVRWVTYLDFNQKFRFLGLFSLIVIVSIACFAVMIRFPQEMREIFPNESMREVFAQINQVIFIYYIMFFTGAYSCFSILVLFFNLPTSID